MSERTDPAPSESEKFRDAMRHIMTVPKDEILRREAEAKKQRQADKRAKK